MGSSDHPTDLEPGLAALLRRMQARVPAPRPNAEMVELAEQLSSPALAEFTRSLGSYLWLDDLGRFEATAELLDDLDEMVEALAEIDRGGAEWICIGNTGGGEEALLMVAADPAAGGYVICRYAHDGQPYDNGRPIEEVGLIGDLIRSLAREGEISDDLRAVLAELG